VPIDRAHPSDIHGVVTRHGVRQLLRPLRLPTLLWAIGVLYYFPLIRWPVGEYDEGLMVSGAARVLDGAIPYRDFWTIYAPGQFYALAGVFKLFGVSLLASRIYEVLLRASVALACYAVTALLGDRRQALVVWAVVLCWLSQFDPTGYPMFPALLFSMAGVILVIRWMASGGSLASLGLAGAATGVATLFRHDIGAYTAVAQLLTLALWPPRLGGQWAARRPAALGAFMSGLMVVVVPVVLVLVHVVGTNTLVAELIEFPGRVYPRFRAIPFPSYNEWMALSFGPGALALRLRPVAAQVVVWAVPIAVVAGFVSLASLVRRAGLPLSRAAGLFLLLVLGTLFMLQMRVRTDYTHMLPSSLPLLIALPVLGKAAGAKGWSVVAAVAIVVVAIAGVGLAAAGDTRIVMFSRCPVRAAAAEVARRLGPACTTAEQVETAAYLVSEVPPQSPIFVGAERHDRLVVSDAMLYFLAGRKSGTVYAELHPGLTTTRPVQQAMVRDLEHSGVERVVLKAGGFWEEPNASRFSSGVTLLDDFLRATFVAERRFGPYTVYRRRS